MASLLTTLETWPKGPNKVEATKRTMRLETHICTKNSRESSYGVVLVLDRQFEFSRAEKQLPLAEDFFRQVEAH